MNRLLIIPAIALLFATASYANSNEEKHEHGGKDYKAHKAEMLAKLPEEKRKMYEESMSKVKGNSKTTWENIKKLKEEQKAILTADKFNKSAYLEKSEEIKDLFNEKAEAKSAAIAELAEKFTKEEREVLAKISGKHGHHGWNKGDKKPSDDIEESKEE